MEKSRQAENRKEISVGAKVLRCIAVVVIIALLMLLVFFILKWTHLWEKINSVEKLRQLILSWGFWGRFGYVLIQFLQVTFIPIPSTISVLAGVAVYGPLQAGLLSISGILLGSLVAFLLGRIFGRKIVNFMVGEKTCKKWLDYLGDAKYVFFAMMILPFFPDDVICLVAGLTDMSWTFFTVTNLITRPINILITCYFGSGNIIPYSGWGLVAWPIIIVLLVVVIVLVYKYQNKIEKFIYNLFNKKNKKNK